MTAIEIYQIMIALSTMEGYTFGKTRYVPVPSVFGILASHNNDPDGRHVECEFGENSTKVRVVPYKKA